MLVRAPDGAALQGLLPGPLRPPSGTLSSPSPWAVPRPAHGAPTQPLTRRPVTLAPGTADLLLSRRPCERSQNDEVPLPGHQFKLGAGGSPEPAALRALLSQRLGRLPGARAGEGTCPEPRSGRESGQYGSGRPVSPAGVGAPSGTWPRGRDARCSARVGTVRSAHGGARRRGMKGAQPRPGPPPALQSWAARGRRGRSAERRGPSAGLEQRGSP